MGEGDGSRERTPGKVTVDVNMIIKLVTLLAYSVYDDCIPRYGKVHVVRAHSCDKCTHHDLTFGLIYVHRKLAVNSQIFLCRIRGSGGGSMSPLRRVRLRHFIVKVVVGDRSGSGKAVEEGAFFHSYILTDIFG